MQTHTCSLNMEFFDVHSISASSHEPRLYATHARLGSRFSAYLCCVCVCVYICMCGGAWAAGPIRCVCVCV